MALIMTPNPILPCLPEALLNPLHWTAKATDLAVKTLLLNAANIFQYMFISMFAMRMKARQLQKAKGAGHTNKRTKYDKVIPWTKVSSSALEDVWESEHYYIVVEHHAPFCGCFFLYMQNSLTSSFPPSSESSLIGCPHDQWHKRTCKNIPIDRSSQFVEKHVACIHPACHS